MGAAGELCELDGWIFEAPAPNVEQENFLDPSLDAESPPALDEDRPLHSSMTSMKSAIAWETRVQLCTLGNGALPLGGWLAARWLPGGFGRQPGAHCRG